MATSTRTTSSDPLLASVRGQVDLIAEAEVDKLALVLAWAEANDASRDEWLELTDPAVEPALHLAGVGAPCVPEYAALDLALSLGMSTDGGFRYLARALELCHRLPRLYRRVTRLEVPVWKAFRIAEQTIALTEAAAWHVDRHIAPVADRVHVRADRPGHRLRGRGARPRDRRGPQACGPRDLPSERLPRRPGG